MVASPVRTGDGGNKMVFVVKEPHHELLDSAPNPPTPGPFGGVIAEFERRPAGSKPAVRHVTAVA